MTGLNIYTFFDLGFLFSFLGSLGLLLSFIDAWLFSSLVLLLQRQLGLVGRFMVRDTGCSRTMVGAERTLEYSSIK